MRLCVLDNDVLDPEVAPTYTGYGAMLVRLLREAGANWDMDVFTAVHGQCPAFSATGVGPRTRQVAE